MHVLWSIMEVGVRVSGQALCDMMRCIDTPLAIDTGRETFWRHLHNLSSMILNLASYSKKFQLRTAILILWDSRREKRLLTLTNN